MTAAEHPFWFYLTISCLIWYGTVTVVIAWKGVADIRTLLRRLKEHD